MIFDDISEIYDGVAYGIYDGKVVIINLKEDSSSDWDKSGNKKGYLNQVVKINTSTESVKASKLKKKAQKFTAKDDGTYRAISADKTIKIKVK